MSIDGVCCTSQVLEPTFRAPYANVNRWFVTCINQNEFSEVLGQVELCTKMAQFDGESGVPDYTVKMVSYWGEAPHQSVSWMILIHACILHVNALAYLFQQLLHLCDPK